MTIQFWLDTKPNATHITTMYDMVSNPFKEGDVVRLSVSSIPPVELAGFNEQAAEILGKENRRLREMFGTKSIKLTREGKYLDIQNDKLTIEYHCEFVD